MSHSVMGNKSGSSPKGMPLLGKINGIYLNFLARFWPREGAHLILNLVVFTGMVNQADLEALVRTLRRLLAAVTRILLLAILLLCK